MDSGNAVLPQFESTTFLVTEQRKRWS